MKRVEAPELLACPCGKLPQLTLGEKDRGLHPSLVTMRLACSGNVDGHIVAGPVVVGGLADTPQSAHLLVQAEDAWNAMFTRTPDQIAGLVSALERSDGMSIGPNGSGGSKVTINFSDCVPAGKLFAALSDLDATFRGEN